MSRHAGSLAQTQRLVDGEAWPQAPPLRHEADARAHDLDVALTVSTYVTMMHNGRIFTEGTPDQIENDPQVQEIYLGAGHG